MNRTSFYFLLHLLGCHLDYLRFVSIKKIINTQGAFCRAQYIHTHLADVRDDDGNNHVGDGDAHEKDEGDEQELDHAVAPLHVLNCKYDLCKVFDYINHVVDSDLRARVRELYCETM